MNKTRGLVNRILRFSVVDGPGNRFVLFLQGCSFNCINCHNPHTIGICSLCGICVDECPGRALELITWPEERIVFDSNRCLNCDRCLAVCPVKSNPRARQMEVEDVLHELRPVTPFISGVTVSGGEATVQAKFVRELFAAIKDEQALQQLTTFIDSNGNAGLQVWKDLLLVMDGAMIDLKALNPSIHRTLTGTDNQAVFRSIAYLHSVRKLYEIRYLIIPEYNAGREQLRELADYIHTLDPGLRLKLNAFRKHGVRDLAGQALREPQPDEMQSIMQTLVEAGLTNVVL